ncbi:breast cancer type 1 susceptibility protein-like isoform X1 [Leptotrombidium deliense]|uniref:Breast cancer type 1 susceptibility protein-like isoform X1 n=1 Tax=Leptotrombidium deliense TaxID=299467 RepID=A0A443SF62_9ACAR|nr:breast cancer type 1 susceptibility protein-like isoform X1 [Leptotrombidium deliense]
MGDNLVEFRNNFEQWLRKCVLCRKCGKVPNSVWKAKCDHLYCDVCKESTEKCIHCACPLVNRSKKNEVFVCEELYGSLIEASKELIDELEIDVSTLKSVSPIKCASKQVRAKQMQRGKRKNLSPEKKNEVENKRMLCEDFDDFNEEKPENKFGKRSYTNKKEDIPELSRTLRKRSDKLFDKVLDSTVEKNDIEIMELKRDANVDDVKVVKIVRKRRAKQEPLENKAKAGESRKGRPPKRDPVLGSESKEISKSANVSKMSTPQKSPNKRTRTSEKTESVSTIKSESTVSKGSSVRNSIVLASTSLTKSQTNELSKFRKKFFCEYKESYDNDVTHIICRTVDENYTSRTIKYLHGLVGNKWLVNFEWIEDSLREGELLDEQAYEISGTCKDKEASNGAPKKSRTSKQKLFEGFVAYFEGKFVPQNIPPKDEMMKLFKSAGGNVADTTHRLNAAIKRGDKIIVVREDGQKHSAITESLKAVNVADFLSMITEFRINDAYINFG